MADYDTFKDIKVGDKVLLVHCGWHHRTYKVTEVTKVNKTTFQVNNSGFTFRKYDGYVYGNQYSAHFVEPYNEEKYNKWLEEKEEREKRNNLISAINNATLSDLTTAQLVQINNIIVPQKPNETITFQFVDKDSNVILKSGQTFSHVQEALLIASVIGKVLITEGIYDRLDLQVINNIDNSILGKSTYC